MKKSLLLTLSLAFTFSIATAFAQRGGGMGGGQPAGPDLSGPMAKLFGENSSFSANLEFQLKDNSGQPMTMPGKIAADAGKSRFEVDMTKAAGSRMTPEMGVQMKAMGMGSMVMISVPEKKLTYLVYPGMNSYVESPMKDTGASAKLEDYKIDITELGKETLEGHPCVKNKVVVTDDKGKTHESTVWNAQDMKKFPVKIESTQNGSTVTMLFKDVKSVKPEASQFEPPAGATKYDSMMNMMQNEMMKRRGGGGQ
jgi:hypothetical protein